MARLGQTLPGQADAACQLVRIHARAHAGDQPGRLEAAGGLGHGIKRIDTRHDHSLRIPRPDLSVGDGVYKSTDAGATWTHLGLRDGQQIPYIIVDPRNADRLFVAVLGHPYGPNEERGVYRSTDGGRTFQKVLSKDENTGASDLEFDPRNPEIVYACLWEQRQGPWENGAWAGTSGGIFKSTDGGGTWRQLTDGLPSGEADGGGVVQADVAVAPSDPNRIYATVANPRGVGIYRSDDAAAAICRCPSSIPRTPTP